MTSNWSPAAVALIGDRALPQAPLIAAAPPLLPGFDLWDFWPVQEVDGQVAVFSGSTLYFFLAAPAGGDPDERHACAHLRLLRHDRQAWHDLGPAFPPGVAPGSRQWSGSAVVDAEHRRLTLYFTAAGEQGEATLAFRQRLFAAEAAVDEGGTIGAWSHPVEIVAPVAPYMRDMAGGGALGTIKAFRDPYFFRDPVDGSEQLLFTASLAASKSPWNGAVGVARRVRGAWRLAPPLIAADGVNNELERPHVLVHAGAYYCFWSTQAKVFAVGLAAPTGLYGMVADAFAGPWRPLNGSGLVVANPVAAPHQAYSWLVLPDLRVLSFADMVGAAAAPADAAAARRHFGGTPAPVLRLRLAGDRAVLA